MFIFNLTKQTKKNAKGKPMSSEIEMLKQCALEINQEGRLENEH